MRGALAITVGDPAGIGPEIVVRAIEEIDSRVPLRIYGNWDLTRQSLVASGIAPSIEVVSLADETETNGKMLFIDVAADAELETLRIGEVSLAAGRAALQAIDAAVSAIEAGRVQALVTAPINKAAIRLAGATVPGHTELLANRAGLERYGHDYAMYFDSPTLRVALLTVHVPLHEVPSSISSEAILGLAALVDREYHRLEGSRPRIGVAGLNPHAGEDGLFGREEETISAAVDAARAQQIDISGPLPPDTIFHTARGGRYDVVLAMYHDQGLIAVKTLHFNESVNVTIGLPYLRGSVDHGTAFDIAGKGIADHGPMKHAIEWTLARMDR